MSGRRLKTSFDSIWNPLVNNEDKRVANKPVKGSFMHFQDVSTLKNTNISKDIHTERNIFTTHTGILSSLNTLTHIYSFQVTLDWSTSDNTVTPFTFVYPTDYKANTNEGWEPIIDAPPSGSWDNSKKIDVMYPIQPSNDYKLVSSNEPMKHIQSENSSLSSTPTKVIAKERSSRGSRPGINVSILQRFLPKNPPPKIDAPKSNDIHDTANTLHISLNTNKNNELSPPDTMHIAQTEQPKLPQQPTQPKIPEQPAQPVEDTMSVDNEINISLNDSIILVIHIQVALGVHTSLQCFSCDTGATLVQSYCRHHNLKMSDETKNELIKNLDLLLDAKKSQLKAVKGT
ncbi:hypothetical protein BDB01DRAFT_812564, partial [Pilobolus umbonatus]